MTDGKAVKRMKAERGHDGISGMFVSTAVAMIFSSVAGFLATTIDGMITGRFLGHHAYSAVSLFAPMINIILLFAYFIAIGGQVLSSRQIGAGEKKQANAVFSFSVSAGLVIAAAFLLLGFLFPEALFRICGVSAGRTPELHTQMDQYFRGYLLGIPALILAQVLCPFIVLDNGKKLISVSAAVLCVSDILGDLLNVRVFHGGIFGMGVATSVSLLLQLAVLLTHFFRGHSCFRLSLKEFRASFLRPIFQNGALTFMRSLATILRDLFTNHLNLAVAVTTAAVAARGIQSDVNTLLFCIGIGIGKALLPMTAMFYGAGDRDGLKRLFVSSIRTSVLFAGVTGAAVFLAAPWIVRFYFGQGEVVSLAVFGLRCMAAGIVFDTVSMAFQNYLQGIQRLKLVNLLCFAERLFIPCAVAYVMGTSFGPKGVMASLAVSKLLLFILMFAIVCFCHRGLPRRAEDCMLLPGDFGAGTDRELAARVYSMEDAVRLSEAASRFCLDRGLTAEKANLMALFAEEMAGNVVRHGKPRGRRKVVVDFRLYVKEGKICLCLRDYCEAFDPTRYYEAHQHEGPGQNFGIRMVMKLARDVRYTYSFNSNCIMILMDEAGGKNDPG